MKSSKFSSAMKMIRHGAWKLLSLILGAMAMVLMMLLPLAVLRGATEHWAWGFAFIVILGVLIYIGVQDFRRGEPETWQGIRAIVLVLWLTILVFAFLTFGLKKVGVAHYQGFTREAVAHPFGIIYTLISFYAWQLFELIPGVNINEAFGWNSPLVKFGFVAGFLLIVFRVVITFVLLKAFRDWWVKRGADSTLENYKALVRRWFEEVWNKGRADAIDEMFAADGIAHGLSDDPYTPLRGPAGFKILHEQFRGAFPDITVVIEDMIAEGDKVAARCSVRGKHAGDHLGVTATNAQIDFTGMTLMRIKDGKIVEGWNTFDFMRMNRQIGAI